MVWAVYPRMAKILKMLKVGWACCLGCLMYNHSENGENYQTVWGLWRGNGARVPICCVISKIVWTFIWRIGCAQPVKMVKMVCNWDRSVGWVPLSDMKQE